MNFPPPVAYHAPRERSYFTVDTTRPPPRVFRFNKRPTLQNFVPSTSDNSFLSYIRASESTELQSRVRELWRASDKGNVGNFDHRQIALPSGTHVSEEEAFVPEELGTVPDLPEPETATLLDDTHTTTARPTVETGPSGTRRTSMYHLDTFTPSNVPPPFTIDPDNLGTFTPAPFQGNFEEGHFGQTQLPGLVTVTPQPKPDVTLPKVNMPKNIGTTALAAGNLASLAAVPSPYPRSTLENYAAKANQTRVTSVATGALSGAAAGAEAGPAGIVAGAILGGIVADPGKTTIGSDSGEVDLNRSNAIY